MFRSVRTSDEKETVMSEAKSQLGEKNAEDYGGPTFGDLYCKKFGIRKSQFNRKIFFSALLWSGWPLCAFLYFFTRNFFARDLALIDDLANVQDRREFLSLVHDYHQRNRLEVGSIRNEMHLRISVKRLLRLESDVCGHHPMTLRKPKRRPEQSA
jgi:hypothetical protein